ncbi:hypothetical protein [Streptomyces sp. NPDC002746]
MEIVADATKPMQAKQIVPRIGLPAVTAKIEGTRGKLKRLVERGWLSEERPGCSPWPTRHQSRVNGFNCRNDKGSSFYCRRCQPVRRRKKSAMEHR